MEPQMEMQEPEEAGRGTDSADVGGTMAHMTLGEVVIPREFLQDSDVVQMLQALFEQNQANLAEFTVGDPANKINPETGYPEFGFFKSLGKIFKKVAPIAASFIPGIGPLGAAAIGAGSGLLGGGGLKGALTGGALGYVGGGGLNDTALARGINSISNSAGVGNIFGSSASGGLTGSLSNGISDAFGSVGDTAIGRGINDAYNGVMGSSSGATLPGIGKVDLGTGSGIRGAVDSVRSAAPSIGGITGGASGGGSTFNLAGTAANIFGGLNQDAALKKQQKQLLGANSQQLANLDSFDPSGITSDPGYQFNLEQGQKGLERTLAASGSLNSGKALKAATEFNQNYAANSFKDYYNRWLQKTQGQNELYGQAGNTKAQATGAGAQNLSQSLANIIGSPVGAYGQNNSQLEILKRLGLAGA